MTALDNREQALNKSSLATAMDVASATYFRIEAALWSARGHK